MERCSQPEMLLQKLDITFNRDTKWNLSKVKQKSWKYKQAFSTFKQKMSTSRSSQNNSNTSEVYSNKAIIWTEKNGVRTQKANPVIYQLHPSLCHQNFNIETKRKLVNSIFIWTCCYREQWTKSWLVGQSVCTTKCVYDKVCVWQSVCTTKCVYDKVCQIGEIYI